MSEESLVQSSPHRREWTIKAIRDLVELKFQKRPCWMQIKIALSIRAGKDVVACARTGAGKTLSFYIALLMDIEDGLDKMIFIVTPLNLLGKQSVNGLEKAGLPAIAVSAKNAIAKTFKDIEDKKYRVVVINPEILMTHPEVDKLWKRPAVTGRISYFVFDEGHCIKQWGKFREQYMKLGDLRYLIAENIPFFVASATLPPATLLEIAKLLHLRADKTDHILRSNDRPEIRIMVQGMAFPASSFKDLNFLVPEGYSQNDAPLPAFLIFFNNTKEAEGACKHLRRRMPDDLKTKIKWFHSTMTPEYREEELAGMEQHETWGFCSTDAFGMGMDISNIRVVVQWKAPSDLSTLWQQFGRAARGAGEEGVAILIVQSGDVYENRIRKADKAAKLKEKAREGVGTKRKGAPTSSTAARPTKRRALPNPTDDAPLQPRPTNNSYGVLFEGDSDSESELEDIELPIQNITIVERTANLDERQLHYAKEGQTVSQDKRKVTKRNEVEIGSAMDDFINAGPLGFKCRWVPPRLYFRNDRDPCDDHLRCDETIMTGCSRCSPRPSPVCCDLCAPTLFDIYRVPAVKPTRGSGKSKLKAMNLTGNPQTLKLALMRWRIDKAVIKFGAVIVQTFGSKLFISDDIIDRLVLCAQNQKIHDVAQIVKETNWKTDRAQEFGPSLLLILHSHYPLPAPPAATAIEPAPQALGDATSVNFNAAVPAPPVPRAKAARKCSKCLQEGHISSNSKCPWKIEQKRLECLQIEHRIRLNNKNEPPSHI